MSYLIRTRLLRAVFLSGLLLLQLTVRAQSNLVVRVMAANITSGTQQSYEAPGIRIFQGLKPDVVAIQEFQSGGSTAANDLRVLVNTAFGTEFSFYCEPNNGIPNGIVSRWPIISAGWWDDPFVTDREFAWARIDLPGSNDLYVVSVHLYGSGTPANRGTEAAIIKANIQTNLNLPAGGWVVVGGDMNTENRAEAAIDTFKTFLSDSPIPDDNDSPTPNQNTNEPRGKPYDYVLASFSLTNYLTPVVLASHTLTKGLVFDSDAYTPLSDVSPVIVGDSHVNGMQHMAVVKDFLIPIDSASTNAPSIVIQPQNITVPLGSNATFTVTADGAAPLAYQWRFEGTNIGGANTNSYTRFNTQTNDAGNYTVVVTNGVGSVTSAIAVLTVNSAPMITNQPQSLTVTVGQSATFIVGAGGAAPLTYQWRFTGTNLPGATASSFNRASTQFVDAGNYTVVISNTFGSATSSIATLTVNAVPSGNVIAQWNFNSVPPDGFSTTGTLATAIGSGTVAYAGGTTAASSGEFASGSSTDTNLTDNSAWNTSTYPSAGANNKSAGARFNVSTAGRQNIILRWDQRHSGSASKYTRLQYTTNGTDFLDFPNPGSNSGTTFEPKTNSLADIPAVNENSSFAFRVVAEFESTATGAGNNNYVGTTSAYGTGGTIRFDMVTIFGDPITHTNRPPIAAVLTEATIASGEFSMLVTGSVGSNYIVQASTNLAASVWISLFTNSSPFPFTDTNTASFPEKFYRALGQP